jgi:hypothetical protein
MTSQAKVSATLSVDERPLSAQVRTHFFHGCNFNLTDTLCRHTKFGG